MRMRLFILAAWIAAAPIAASAAGPAGLPPEEVEDEIATEVADRLVVRRILTVEEAGAPEALRAALVRYQSARGLAPTGWIDGDTLASLGIEARPEGELPRNEDGTVDLGGTGSFYQHEGLRLGQAARVLRQRAAGAATPRSRQFLERQAEKAQAVADMHLALVGDGPPPGQPAEPPTVRPGESKPPAVPEETLTRDQVLALQEALQARGLLEEAPSGVLTAPTRAGIAAWQRQRGRAPTGALDQNTFRELVTQNEDDLAVPREAN